MHYPHADNGGPLVCRDDGLTWPCPDSGEAIDPSSFTRSELDGLATDRGIDPSTLSTKATVAEAIATAQRKTARRGSAK